MSVYERSKSLSLTVIIALAGLLIAIVSAQSATNLFPELLLYSIVVILMSIIVVLFLYDFLWHRASVFVNTWLRNKRMNRLARECFEDFRSFIERFTNLPEFSGESRGIIQTLESLLKKANSSYGVMIDTRVKEFGTVLRNAINQFKQRLDELHWQKKEINYEFLNNLVKEFEGYVLLHKQLYVDFTISVARKIGLENIPQVTKRGYSDYKDDYNQFIFAYTEFAKECSKATLYAFSENLRKAEAL